MNSANIDKNVADMNLAVTETWKGLVRVKEQGKDNNESVVEIVVHDNGIVQFKISDTESFKIQIQDIDGVFMRREQIFGKDTDVLYISPNQAQRNAENRTDHKIGQYLTSKLGNSVYPYIRVHKSFSSSSSSSGHDVTRLLAMLEAASMKMSENTCTTNMKIGDNRYTGVNLRVNRVSDRRLVGITSSTPKHNETRPLYILGRVSGR